MHVGLSDHSFVKRVQCKIKFETLKACNCYSLLDSEVLCDSVPLTRGLLNTKNYYLSEIQSSMQTDGGTIVFFFGCLFVSFFFYCFSAVFSLQEAISFLN